MKFVVERASDIFQDKSPCKEATQFEVEKSKQSHYYTHYYVVEINTLEELMKFRNKYGRLIIEELMDFEKEKFKYMTYRIVIYDDYVE